MRVVDVLGNTEDERNVELVKFVMVEYDIVLNTVTVQIVDLSTVPSFLGASHLQSNEILRSLNIVDEVSKSLGLRVSGIELQILRIAITV